MQTAQIVKRPTNARVFIATNQKAFLRIPSLRLQRGSAKKNIKTLNDTENTEDCPRALQAFSI